MKRRPGQRGIGCRNNSARESAMTKRDARQVVGPRAKELEAGHLIEEGFVTVAQLMSRHWRGMGLDAKIVISASTIDRVEARKVIIWLCPAWATPVTVTGGGGAIRKLNSIRIIAPVGLLTMHIHAGRLEGATSKPRHDVRQSTCRSSTDRLLPFRHGGALVQHARAESLLTVALRESFDFGHSLRELA